jgi:hypothetical protein
LYNKEFNFYAMNPIFFTIDDNLPIMVIPNVKIHLDGHAVLTHTYSIFYNRDKDDPARVINQGNIIQDKLDDPDYYGCITFEDPDRLFSFTPEGQKTLTRTELEEIIENIKHYRDNPNLWKNNSSLS